jgi:hypothetical protein
MKVSHIIISDSFTREPRAVAVSFSDAARRSNLAALLREYRAAGFTVRTVEHGAMYRATAAAGYWVSIWYAVPNAHKFAIISAVKTA